MCLALSKRWDECVAGVDPGVKWCYLAAGWVYVGVDPGVGPRMGPDVALASGRARALVHVSGV